MKKKLGCYQFKQNLRMELQETEKAMAPHSSSLAWKIPWTEEPSGLQSMELLRVGHDWATSLSLLTFMRWRRQWQPSPVFLPGESQGGAWWAAVYGVTQSRTRLKWLSSSSSSSRELRSWRPCTIPTTKGKKKTVFSNGLQLCKRVPVFVHQ